MFAMHFKEVSVAEGTSASFFMKTERIWVEEKDDPMYATLFREEIVIGEVGVDSHITKE